MQYRELFPTPRLSRFIKRFWSLEYQPDGPAPPELVLPDGCPEMVFNLSDRFRRLDRGGEEVQPATLFAGQMGRSISIRPTGRVSLFGVRFHPAGAYPLLDFPIHEANDLILDIESCLGSDGVELEERINNAASFEARTVQFEHYVERRLAAAEPPDNSISEAVNTIIFSSGSARVTNIIDAAGVSERTFLRSFRAQTGISPKRLSRIARFQAFIKLIKSAESPGGLDASLELGYFDQSHAIRDFREFSGVTPSEYFRTTHDLSDVFVGST